jgi:hypothetical protein
MLAGKLSSSDSCVVRGSAILVAPTGETSLVHSESKRLGLNQSLGFPDYDLGLASS